MFAESAEFYDRIYCKFNDYKAEANLIHAFLAENAPHVNTFLDVACGTGEHVRILTREYGYKMDGIDLDRSMVDLAPKKNPTGSFYCADMVNFDLERSYRPYGHQPGERTTLFSVFRILDRTRWSGGSSVGNP